MKSQRELYVMIQQTVLVNQLSGFEVNICPRLKTLYQPPEDLALAYYVSKEPASC